MKHLINAISYRKNLRRIHWKNGCTYGVKWNRKTFYHAKHLTRLLARFFDMPDTPFIVSAYLELMEFNPTYDRLQSRADGFNPISLMLDDIPF
jgi:hypothetical protein